MKEARNPKPQSPIWRWPPSDLAGGLGSCPPSRQVTGGAGLVGDWFGGAKPDARLFFFSPGPLSPCSASRVSAPPDAFPCLGLLGKAISPLLCHVSSFSLALSLNHLHL